MNYRNILLLSTFWTLMSPLLEARDVFAAEYNPRTELREDEREQIAVVREFYPDSADKSSTEIQRLFQSSEAYKILQPTVKKWINSNTENYQPDGYKKYLLYLQDEVGIRVVFRDTEKGRFWIERDRFYPDDAAYSYKKEPAINPATKKPWIQLPASTLKKIERQTGQKFSAEDKAFLKDVLMILNENFHYFYGMEFVRLSERNIERESLVGKFSPRRKLLFGDHTPYVMEGDETEQQKEIHHYLGHPIYSYDNLVDPDYRIKGTSICNARGTTYIRLKTGQTTQVVYWVDLDMKRVLPDLDSRAAAVGNAAYSLPIMLNNLAKLCTEKGVDLTDKKANKTPLTRALFEIHETTKLYVDAVANHEYVKQSTRQDSLRRGDARRLSDVVPLPNQGSSDTQTQSKKKVSTQKKKTTTTRRSKDRQR